MGLLQNTLVAIKRDVWVDEKEERQDVKEQEQDQDEEKAKGPKSVCVCATVTCPPSLIVVRTEFIVGLKATLQYIKRK